MCPVPENRDQFIAGVSGSWFGLMHSPILQLARAAHCTPPDGSPPQSLYFSAPRGGEETLQSPLPPPRNLWRSRMSLRYAGLTLEGA